MDEKDLTLEDIIEINKKGGGGGQLNMGSLSFALDAGKNKNVFRKIALLWRAILVDRSFSDADKRTAFDIAAVLFFRHGYQLTDDRKERLAKQLLKVTKTVLDDAKRIEYRLRYAISGGKNNVG
ncbi:MAG: hypothetical protein V1921_04020 [Candidatus Altiarchaeota archaeon]